MKLLPWMLAALLIQLVIDAWLGPRAEYFNAWYVLRTLAGAPDLPYLGARAALGPAALPLASLLLFVQPTLYGLLARGLFRRARAAFSPADRATPTASSPDGP